MISAALTTLAWGVEPHRTPKLTMYLSFFMPSKVDLCLIIAWLIVPHALQQPWLSAFQLQAAHVAAQLDCMACGLAALSKDLSIGSGGILTSKNNAQTVRTGNIMNVQDLGSAYKLNVAQLHSFKQLILADDDGSTSIYEVQS